MAHNYNYYLVSPIPVTESFYFYAHPLINVNKFIITIKHL